MMGSEVPYHYKETFIEYMVSGHDHPHRITVAPLVYSL